MNEGFCYRAVCDHGKTRALVADEPRVLHECRKDIAAWLRDGLHLERVTTEEARKSDIHCPDCDAMWAAKKKFKKCKRSEVHA